MVICVGLYPASSYLERPLLINENLCCRNRCYDPSAIVEYLLPLLPPSALVATNNALSTPLHWIALNYHLSVLRALCPLLPPPAFDAKNMHGKSPVQEAEEGCESWIVEDGAEASDRGRERVRREVCVGYILGCMGLGEKKDKVGKEDAPDATGEDAAAAEEDEEVQVGSFRAEVEGAEEVLKGVQEIRLEDRS